MTTATFSRTIRNAEGQRVVIHCELRDRADRPTVNHDRHMVTEVTFSGEVYARHSSHPLACGQVQEYLTGLEGALIREVWDAYHLNGMRSHCAHQDSSIAWDKVEACEETGYRAGSAWLAEPLSIAGYDAIVALFS